LEQTGLGFGVKGFLGMLVTSPKKRIKVSKINKLLFFIKFAFQSKIKL